MFKRYLKLKIMKIDWVLLKRSVLSDISEEERNLLNAWLDESSEHLELLREMAFVRMSQYEENREEIILGKRRLNRALHGTRRLWVMGSVAASILIILGGLFQIGMIGGRLRGSTEVAAITPGSNKAQLILSDGAIVDLHAAVRQLPLSVIGIIRNDSLEGLKYSGAVGMKEEYNVLQTPVGGFYHLELSDGTRVWLNACSELRYPVSFVGKERRVELKGEAYFQVSRDSLRPFYVQTSRQNIRVLGTSFNVRSYSANQEYTTLESGRVSIHCLGQDCLLRPGEQLRLSDTSVVIVPVRSESYIGWKNQCWVYDNCVLKEVFKDLERWYNVQIELEDESIGLRHFTGNFRRYDNIDTVLEMIGLVAHVKYEVKGREIVFSWK